MNSSVSRRPLPWIPLFPLLLAAFVPADALQPPEGVKVSGALVEFYTFGWSRDGKLAYALVDQPPFRNGHGFTFAIVDARTDEILASLYDHSDQFGAGNEDAFHIAWERNRGEIGRLMGEFGVESGGETAFDPFPLRRGSDRYRVEIAEWRVDPRTSPYENGVVGYTATFHSRERGSKVIAHRGRIFATDITPVGFVRSPFENRLAVLIAESGNTWGANRFTDFTVVGAHLDVGFQ